MAKLPKFATLPRQRHGRRRDPAAAAGRDGTGYNQVASRCQGELGRIGSIEVQPEIASVGVVIEPPIVGTGFQAKCRGENHLSQKSHSPISFSDPDIIITLVIFTFYSELEIYPEDALAKLI